MTRSKAVIVRLTVPEFRALRAAAQARGMAVSVYLRFVGVPRDVPPDVSRTARGGSRGR